MSSGGDPRRTSFNDPFANPDVYYGDPLRDLRQRRSKSVVREIRMQINRDDH